MPDGLEEIDKYPALLAELARRGSIDAKFVAVAGGNMLGVMRANGTIPRKLQATHPLSAAKIDLISVEPQPSEAAFPWGEGLG